MPYAIEVQPEQNLVGIRVWGEVTSELLREASFSILEQSGSRVGFSRLWDWREVTMMLLEPPDVRAFVDQIKENWSDAARVAIVAVRPVDLDIARLIKGLMRSERVEVFDDVEQARRYLGLRA